MKSWHWAALGVGGAIVLLGRKGYQLATQTLQAIAPGLSLERAAEYGPALARAMAGAKITTPPRAAAFLAQVAFETAWFGTLTEYADGSAYEWNAKLGNTEPGDGTRFKGRGFLQLTGRYNYRLAGQALGLPLEQQPELAAEPETAARIAAWYWSAHGLNALADAGDFVGITRAINGGTSGLDERQRAFARALEALGVSTT